MTGAAKGYITPRLSWPRPATPTDLVPTWAGEFKDFNDWVNFAANRLTGTCDPMMGNEVSAICVDAIGRRCSIGAHFMRAQKEGTFPVRFFWDCAPPVDSAPGRRPTSRPMETAPRDGTIVRLLVEFTEHALEDSTEPVWTIGSNNFDHDEQHEWKFAGWCWSHDHYTQGEGKPIGWLPYFDLAPQLPPAPTEPGSSEEEMIEVDGRSYRRFIPYPGPVEDGTSRCFQCGQIDEPPWHDSEICRTRRTAAKLELPVPNESRESHD